MTLADWVWKIVTFLILSFGWAGLSGCQGAPEYAGVKAKPDSEIKFGFGRSVRIGAETEGEMTGFKAGSTEIQSLKIKSSPAQTMAGGWVPTMDAYGRQQVNFVPILKQYGDNAVGIIGAAGTAISQVISSATPILNAYVSAKSQVAALEAQKPMMLAEVVAAAKGGQVDPSVIKFLPPDVQADALAKINAEIAELKKRLPAATQPESP